MTKKKSAPLKFPAFDLQFYLFTFAVFGCIEYLDTFLALPMQLAAAVPFSLLWLYISFSKLKQNEKLKTLLDEDKNFELFLKIMRGEN